MQTPSVVLVTSGIPDVQFCFDIEAASSNLQYLNHHHLFLPTKFPILKMSFLRTSTAFQASLDELRSPPAVYRRHRHASHKATVTETVTLKEETPKNWELRATRRANEKTLGQSRHLQAKAQEQVRRKQARESPNHRKSPLRSLVDRDPKMPRRLVPARLAAP